MQFGSYRTHRTNLRCGKIIKTPFEINFRDVFRLESVLPRKCSYWMHTRQVVDRLLKQNVAIIIVINTNTQTLFICIEHSFIFPLIAHLGSFSCLAFSQNCLIISHKEFGSTFVSYAIELMNVTKHLKVFSIYHIKSRRIQMVIANRYNDTGRQRIFSKY